MRDFRDAKAMAQTLREALTAKSVSLTHSESLELIAKILGFPDWNVLAAKIQSERQPFATEPDTSARGTDSRSLRRRIMPIHPANPRVRKLPWMQPYSTLYVGFYQLNDNAVFTVTRDENQLITRLTGQGAVPLYAQSDTEFFAKVVDAQISFIPEGEAAGSNIPDPASGRRRHADAADRRSHGAGDCPQGGREDEEPDGESGNRGGASSPD